MDIKQNKINFFIVLILSGIFGNVMALPDWELIAEKNGIKVYSMPDPVSGLKSYKAEMNVEATTDRVVEVIKDIDNYSKWTPKLEGTKLIEKVSSSELYYYSVIKAPMVSNRDLVVHLKSQSFGKTTIIDMKGAPNYIPHKDGLVRMPEYRGVYKITPGVSNSVNISLEYKADPGGNLPNWIVNNNTDDVPLQMFLNLKALF